MVFFQMVPYVFAETDPSLLSQINQLKNGQEQTQARLAGLLEKSLNSYETLRDYSAIFYKEERSEKKLGAKEKIFMKFEKPFKIFMKWLDTSKEGVQVLYERGRHRNKLVVHKPGLFLGLAPIVFLDQNSPWVKEGSASYNIEDAGLGTFLLDYARDVLKALKEKKLQINFPDQKLSEGGDTVEVVFAGSDKTSGYMAYRIVTFFDQNTHFPTRMRLFDWDNEPMGNYSYEELKLNAGPEEAAFKSQIQRQLYKLYNNIE